MSTARIIPLLLLVGACSAAYQAQNLEETDGGTDADASVQDASVSMDAADASPKDASPLQDGGPTVVDRCASVTCKENARCDGATGTLTRGALDDAVVRINLFRWLVGLAPAVDDPASFTSAMQCATVAAWNPPGTVPNPHAPPTSAKCYTPGGLLARDPRILPGVLAQRPLRWTSGSKTTAMTPPSVTGAGS